jgi:hypothetical protein
MAKKKEIAQFFQGDIWIMRLPDDIVVEKEGEIAPINGKLILQEGEMTGHHHHIDLLERPAPVKEGKFADDKLNKMFLENEMKPAEAHMYRGSKTAQDLVNKKILLRADLVVGLLEIENGPMRVAHQEHSPILLSPGKYVVGRQIESVAGEERRVAD